jgi:hypothetical protein
MTHYYSILNFSSNGWENIIENERNHNRSSLNQTRTPERKEVGEIRSRYSSKSVDPIDSWNNEQRKH